MTALENLYNVLSEINNSQTRERDNTGPPKINKII